MQQVCAMDEVTLIDKEFEQLFESSDSEGDVEEISDDENQEAAVPVPPPATTEATHIPAAEMTEEALRAIVTAHRQDPDPTKTKRTQYALHMKCFAILLRL
jgi:hypothetical protein